MASLADRKVTSTAKLEGCIMAIHRIQFQPGLSIPEFLKACGTEAQRGQAREAIR